MSDLLERTDEKVDLKVTDNGDHDKYKHYIYKEGLGANILEGAPLRTLCGRTIGQQVDPNGRTLCPECEDMMENVVGMNRPEWDRD